MSEGSKYESYEYPNTCTSRHVASAKMRPTKPEDGLCPSRPTMSQARHMSSGSTMYPWTVFRCLEMSYANRFILWSRIWARRISPFSSTVLCGPLYTRMVVLVPTCFSNPLVTPLLNLITTSLESMASLWYSYLSLPLFPTTAHVGFSLVSIGHWSTTPNSPPTRSGRHAGEFHRWAHFRGVIPAWATLFMLMSTSHKFTWPGGRKSSSPGVVSRSSAHV
mmetsp:Transcript_55090/g.175245  ORF Transcript_55090/g.175245 Transcript_55090/m.175245 type:complete len:220 (+) Transcript_55090:527-1186(+)